MAETTSKMDAFRIGFHSLPWGLIIFCFIFYFIGGYLLYASLFAAIGSVVSEDQNEAQSMVFPVMMPIILGFDVSGVVRAMGKAVAGFSIGGRPEGWSHACSRSHLFRRGRPRALRPSRAA